MSLDAAGAAPSRADVARVPATGPAEISDAHQALAPLLEAARRTRAKIVVLPVPMHWQERGWLGGPLKLLIKFLCFLPPHFRLAWRLWRLRDCDLIVVREFLTAPILMVWPLIWPLRQRVYFLVNHNLQEAHRRGFERRALRLLHRTGFRIACFETTEGFAEIGITPDAERFLVIPHPLSDAVPAGRTWVLKDEPVVGVIGEVRAEKGSEDLLEMLVGLRAEGRLRAGLLLGCPEAKVRAQWRARGFETVDTGSREAYLAVLRRCTVVVLNYQQDRYRYRPSGVAADALARGAAVVCPDFPLMRSQLENPAAVGAVFGDLGGLGDALERALELRPRMAAALEAQVEARGAAALARLLDAFVTRLGGSERA